MRELSNDFEQKVSLVLFRMAMAIGAGSVLLLTADIVLLIFAGLLLAVFLVSLAELVSRYLKLSHGASLTLVVLVFIVAGYFVLASVAPAISVQVDRLTTMIPEALEALVRELERHEWGTTIIRGIQQGGIARPGLLYSGATGVLAGTAGWLVSAIIVLFVGLYAASNPWLYQRGVVRLFPPRQREKVAQIVVAIGRALQWWLIGRLTGMAIVGTVTTFALNLMDIPLSGVLGLLSGLLTFIPNLGPIISAIPVVLIALMESPGKALMAGVFYIFLQMMEGYVLTPLILQRTVSLPPALLLSAQAIMGSMLGLAGIAMAAPLTVIGMVLVVKVWLEKVENPGNAA